MIQEKSPRRTGPGDESRAVKLIAMVALAVVFGLGSARVVQADPRAGAPAERSEPGPGLSTRPSHHGTYRAGVVARRGGRGRGAAESWIVRVERADGAPVPDATLRVDAWMPEGGETAGSRPSATRLGGGRYRIDHLRFPAPGWWSVPVRITAGGRTDSLAFNVVVPGPEAAGPRSAASAGDP